MRSKNIDVHTAEPELCPSLALQDNMVLLFSMACTATMNQDSLSLGSEPDEGWRCPKISPSSRRVWLD